jgi:hypothetical protein
MPYSIWSRPSQRRDDRNNLDPSFQRTLVQVVSRKPRAYSLPRFALSCRCRRALIRVMAGKAYEEVEWFRLCGRIMDARPVEEGMTRNFGNQGNIA